MEKIWEELKKIEAQAEQIRGETLDKAKEMTDLAQKEAEELLTNSATYAEEEAQQLYMSTTQEANRSRDELLKANHVAADKLSVQAEKHIEPAVEKVVNAVIEETQP
jgi:F0F1-type ATP synthase membrane subunit b/b'